MAQDKDQKTLNVPPLRFPGFTDEWKKTTLGEIGSGFNYGLNAPAKEFDGVNKYIRITDIDDSSGAYIEDDKVSPNGILTQDYIVKDNDILLARTGASTGKSYLYNPNDGKLYFAGFLIRFNVSSANPYFVYSILHTRNYWKWVSIMSARSGQPGVNSQEYSSYSLNIPSYEEQDRIASLLRLLDERIATQNKIIEDLKKLKSAIIDKLYSEVKGEIYMYSDIFTVVTERNNKRLYNTVIAASQEFGMVERESLNLKVQFDEESINTYKIINSGDYVIHLRSFQGGFAFSRLQGICSPAYIILRPNERLEYSYFENYFTSSKFINSLRLVTYGIRDGRSINVEEWLSMKVTLPSKDEQKRIIQTIQSIQDKIVNETNILYKLDAEREYCLQAMFI